MFDKIFKKTLTTSFTKLIILHQPIFIYSNKNVQSTVKINNKPTNGFLFN